MANKIEVKHEHMFKNKIQMFIYLIIFGILLYSFIYFASLDYNDNLSDYERFASEFSLVGKDNVFKYVYATDARMVASGSKGIVLFGTNNEWVNYYASIVNDVAKEVGIDEIYYYDFLSDRKENNGTYEDIVEKLSDYCLTNDRGVQEIYAPTLLVVSKDQVLLFDTDTNFIDGNITPEIYYSDFVIGEKKQVLRAVFKEYLES